jgi:hypothetical protein
MSRIKLVFVAMFFTLSILPVLQWTTGIFDISSLEEKRQLAPLPSIATAVLHGDGRLSNAINKWFDDRYGFRALLVRLKNQLDYWAFRHSDKIFIGSDGWLYLPGFFSATIAAQRAGDAGAEDVHQHYVELARYLSGRGIRLIVISNPDKESTYPQYLPANVPYIPADNRYQQLRVWLKSRRELDYIDGQDILEQCGSLRAFHLIDIHMTFAAGVCFAKAMIDQIARDEGRPHSPWDHTFTYSKDVSDQGGQADFLSLLVPVWQPVDVPDHTYLDLGDPAFSTDPRGIFEWIYHAPEDKAAGLLPAVVMYGNSFLDHYRGAGIQTYLAAVYRARDQQAHLATVLKHLPPETRYFVFQFLEPWVNAVSTDAIPSAVATGPQPSKQGSSAASPRSGKAADDSGRAFSLEQDTDVSR